MKRVFNVGIRRPPPATPADLQTASVEPLFHLWAAFFGLLLFAGYVLYQHGVWAALLSADPTFLTALIVVLFIGSSAWVGLRAQVLERELGHFAVFERLLETDAQQARDWLRHGPASWARDYFQALHGKGAQWRDNAQLSSLLGERASAAHEMAWWTNGVLLKLGLLGKVIGFSIMSMQLGALESFDPGQTTAVLKTLTGGLGIALLTTMTGLAANILLGLQLMRLDRYADLITARGIRLAEARLHRIMDA